MSELAAALGAVHTAISDLAAVLVAVRAALAGDCVRARNHLEMGEIDLLSAQDAVEKACWEVDLIVPPPGDVRVSVPRAAIAMRGVPGSVGAEVRSRGPGRRRAGTRRAGFPGDGQGELFSIGDVISRPLQLT